VKSTALVGATIAGIACSLLRCCFSLSLTCAACDGEDEMDIQRRW